MGDMSDGRSARRERNREAVLDALVELTTKGDHDPSIDDIADLAGVSYRSVYRYFEDRTAMMEAATDRALAWIQPLLVDASGPVTPNDPVDHRIELLVSSRVDVYAKIADMVRQAMIQAFSNRKIAEHFRDARRLSRRQIQDRFSDELKLFTPQESELRVSVIDQVLSFSCIDYMTDEREHGRDDLERFLRRAIRSALTFPGPAA